MSKYLPEEEDVVRYQELVVIDGIQHFPSELEELANLERKFQELDDLRYSPLNYQRDMLLFTLQEIAFKKCSDEVSKTMDLLSNCDKNNEQLMEKYLGDLNNYFSLFISLGKSFSETKFTSLV